MNKEKDQPISDVVDQATEALRETLLNISVPAGPPVELASATIKAIQASTTISQTSRIPGRKRPMFRITRYSGLAASAAFVAMLAGWVSVTHRTAALAFADVVGNVKRAQSVTFVSTMPGPQSRGMRQKFYIQGDAYRMELPSDQEGFAPPADAPPVLIAVVADAKRKEVIQIDFSRKTVRKIQAADKSWQAMAQGLANPVDRLRGLTADDAEPIADEILDGHKTHVYRLKGHDIFMGVGVGKDETAKLWVDPASGLPLRLAVERAVGDDKTQTILCFDRFTWNEAIDPDLFSLDVPQGYAVEDATENDSARLGGEAPPNVAELRSLEKRIREAAAKVTPSVVAIGLAPGQPSLFRHHLPSASGVIVTADGLILSQYHVTHLVNPLDFDKSRKPGERVNVVLSDGRECEARLLGADRAYDLSLLRLVEPGPYPFSAIDEKVAVSLGDRLLYVGHPLGYRPGRAPVVRLGTALFWQGDTFVSDFQTSGGDSGGAAFDLDGHMVGLVRNSGVPQVLQGSFRRVQVLFAGSTIALIHSRLDSMRRGEFPAVDAASMHKAHDLAQTAKTLPTERWTQGSETMSAYRDVVKLARASVVAIQDRDGDVFALGTVVGSDGDIVTKASELPAEPMCRLTDGRIVAAAVVGVDPAFDLALLKAPATGLRAVEWSDNEPPSAGTLLVAPGQGEAPLAIGIVSAPRRKLEGPYPAKMVPRRAEPAALPEVIGSAVQGRGYWIEYAEGKAAAAGLEPGDVLLAIAGRAVRHHQDLAECVQGRWADERVPVRLLRGGQELTLSLQMRAEGQPVFSRRNDDFPTVFEQDLPLTADECGGPAVGLDGKALGVTIARVGPHGCMAIPADCVQRLLPDLMSGKLAANWIKPERPASVADSEQPGTKTGEPVTLTVDELKNALGKRSQAFKSLLVEYDLVTEALVEPRLLMSWNLHHVRDWQERHQIAFAGEKRFTRIERGAVMPLYAPADQVVADPNAPRLVAVKVERQRQDAVSRKKKGNSSYLFAATRAETLASIFDGRDCFRWSAQANRMVPAHDASAYHSPLMYLAGLGLRPVDPVSAANTEQRQWQRQFWFPENFAVYETCRVLPTEEFVDEAACVVLVAEFHLELEGQRRLFTEKIYFDPALGFAPRKWESQVGGAFAGMRTNSQFDEFAPGCWLPWESSWTRGTPAWVAPEVSNQPAYAYHMRLRKVRVNDVSDDVLKP